MHVLCCCGIRYGKLNVGDQILVCDGVNLIDVTHDEAAQALKKAMDMDSVSCRTRYHQPHLQE